MLYAINRHGWAFESHLKNNVEDRLVDREPFAKPIFYAMTAKPSSGLIKQPFLVVMQFCVVSCERANGKLLQERALACCDGKMNNDHCKSTVHAFFQPRKTGDEWIILVWLVS